MTLDVPRHAGLFDLFFVGKDNIDSAGELLVLVFLSSARRDRNAGLAALTFRQAPVNSAVPTV